MENEKNNLFFLFYISYKNGINFFKKNNLLTNVLTAHINQIQKIKTSVIIQCF